MGARLSFGADMINIPHQGFTTAVLLTFVQANSLLGGGCPVHDRFLGGEIGTTEISFMEG